MALPGSGQALERLGFELAPTQDDDARKRDGLSVLITTHLMEDADRCDRLLIVGEPDANDTRCGTCGSLLYSVVRQGAFVHVAMGTLVDAPTIRPSAHIFVGSKAPWFTIIDGLPQFEEFPPRASED